MACLYAANSPAQIARVLLIVALTKINDPGELQWIVKEYQYLSTFETVKKILDYWMLTDGLHKLRFAIGNKDAESSTKS